MKTDRQELIQKTLQYIIHLFSEGNVPQAIKIATFPKLDIPSSNWSLSNRILMYLRNTEDARTWKQWQKAQRQVKKEEKAFYIFAPRKYKVKCKDDNGEENEKYVLKGFSVVPVFTVEQTEGEILDYQQLELPRFPLLEKAQDWNIDVSAIGFSSDYYGYYQSSGEQEKIRLASPHEIVFFHELAHSSHRRVLGKLKNGQNEEQEIVAELSAQVLAQIVGTQIESTLGNSFLYIKSYAQRMGKDVGVACLSVLSQVEKVLHLILDVHTEKEVIKHESNLCS
ncbi:ArdC-like ssDNA-binding domain-containing protein [Candidatus Uabimicrobium sp. HlEnr_7]|uniref:ArdC-like ssDNA-binding domain-containing protein n=1 Tax=Candidatus Uabimicrobium helgolandensis TaxID=3095367 RepID=UPI003555FCF6